MQIRTWREKLIRYNRWRRRGGAVMEFGAVVALVGVLTSLLLLLAGCASFRGSGITETVVTHYDSDGEVTSTEETHNINPSRSLVTFGSKLAEGSADLHYEANQSANGDFLIETGSGVKGMEAKDPLANAIGLLQAITALSPSTATPSEPEIVQPAATLDQTAINEAFNALWLRIEAMEGRIAND